LELFDLREPASGWSHCAGLPLALPGSLLLRRRSSGDQRVKRLSLLVFGLSGKRGSGTFEEKRDGNRDAVRRTKV
jgi:hypothetical protein